MDRSSTTAEASVHCLLSGRASGAEGAIHEGSTTLDATNHNSNRLSLQLQELSPEGRIGRSMLGPVDRTSWTPLRTVLEPFDFSSASKEPFIKQKSVTSAWKSSKRRVVSMNCALTASTIQASYGGRGHDGTFIARSEPHHKYTQKLQYKDYCDVKHPNDPELSSVSLLTISECYALQDFREHERCNTTTTNLTKNFCYKGLGNAVTVGVAEAVIAAMVVAHGVRCEEDEESRSRRSRLTESNRWQTLKLKRCFTKSKVEYFTYV